MPFIHVLVSFFPFFLVLYFFLVSSFRIQYCLLFGVLPSSFVNISNCLCLLLSLLVPPPPNLVSSFHCSTLFVSHPSFLPCALFLPSTFLLSFLPSPSFHGSCLLFIPLSSPMSYFLTFISFTSPFSFLMSSPSYFVLLPPFFCFLLSLTFLLSFTSLLS